MGIPFNDLKKASVGASVYSTDKTYCYGCDRAAIQQFLCFEKSCNEIRLRCKECVDHHTELSEQELFTLRLFHDI